MKIEVKEECNEEEISNEPELEYYKIEPVDLGPEIQKTEQELDIFKSEPCDKDRIPLFISHFDMAAPRSYNTVWGLLSALA